MFKNCMTVGLWTSLLIGILGCDDRATQIAREAADRQAQQNTVVTDLNKEVASGAHELVEADAQARRAIVGVHHDLTAERSRLDLGWTQLENERRVLAGERRTESLLVALASVGGAGLLIVVAFAFCWFVLIGIKRDDSSVELNEFVLSEILSDSQVLTAPEAQSRLSENERGSA